MKDGAVVGRQSDRARIAPAMEVVAAGLVAGVMIAGKRGGIAAAPPFSIVQFLFSASVSSRNRQIVDVRPAARRFVPHLKPGDEVKNVRRRQPAAVP